MQATLDASSLKPFTRALTCLSKYGDDLAIYATPDILSLSATNSSMSAYCRFKCNRQFFVKYNVGGVPQAVGSSLDVEEVSTVTGQLLTKSLLSILKHRTVEKTVDRCELSIVEGSVPTQNEEPDDDRDSLESKLIVRLHCKHGVVKTHRLLLITQTSLMAPGVPDAPHESRLRISPKAIKDMIDHFAPGRSVKSDPQLIWHFGESEVEVKSLESSIDAKGKAQLATELTISATEFDDYDVQSPPVTIAFHLREFNATIAFAESMSLYLDMRFTDPAAPLFIDVEGDTCETLFVISTSQVHNAGASDNQPRSTPSINNKRVREDDLAHSRLKKPMKAVQRTDPTSHVQAMNNIRDTVSRSSSRSVGSMPPPSFRPPLTSPTFSQAGRNREPLFLPGSSQLSVLDEAAIRRSGLGIEDMGPDELAAMLEDDGDEVGLDFGSQAPRAELDGDYDMVVRGQDDGSGLHALEESGREDSFDFMDETELAATQTGNISVKTFQPLFED